MELEREDGSRIKLKPDDPDNNNNTVFGRFNTNDRRISRRHVLFTEPSTNGGGGGWVVSFEVLGKNPIWVLRRNRGGIGFFRRFEKGNVEEGDWFCVCGQDPVWFNVKRIEETELGFDDDSDFDVSNIDPVKEFGFLVIGHEFDQYPKQTIHDVRDWDWFLDEPRKNNDDDEEDGEVKRGIGRKRKKMKGNEDDDWTSDDDEEKEQIVKARKVPSRNCSTRSTARKKPQKDFGQGQHSTQKRGVREKDDDDEDDDNDDETMGGFIVSDNDVEPEEESDFNEEEEEEEDEDNEDEDED